VEKDILLAIHSQANPMLDIAIPLLTALAEPTFIGAFAVAIGLVYVIRRKWAWAVLWLGGVAGAGAIAYVLKHIVARPRPELWERLVVETGYSLPSGHAVASMAVAACVVIMLWHTKWRRLAIVLGSLYVVLIGFTRLYLGVHYPTDVLAGWLIASVWLIIVGLLLGKLRYLKPSLESSKKV